MHFPEDILQQVFSGKILKQLNDSKKLTEKKREFLFDEIREVASPGIFQMVSNKHIDANGINHSIYYAIQKLVIKSGKKNLFLLIDGNYNFSSYPDSSAIQYKSIIQGDSRVISIAAASILAKVGRDRFMQKISGKFPGFDFDKHKGYGTKNHLQAIASLGYTRMHRKSYKIQLPQL